MAMKIRPRARSVIMLLLSPFYTMAASPWKVTDGSTLQVTSGYDATEPNDIPLQVSGAGSQLTTDSDLSFSTSASGTPVARVTDLGSLTLHNASLTATENASSAAEAVSGTLTLIGGSLTAYGTASAGVKATASNSTLTDTTIFTSNNARGLTVYGGNLTAENVFITSDYHSTSGGIEIWSDGASYGQVTLNNSTVHLTSEEDEQAIYIHEGHFTGNNVTVNSATLEVATIVVGDDAADRSSLTLNDSIVNTGYVGISMTGGDATLNNVEIDSFSTLHGSYALDIGSNAHVVVRGGSYRTSARYSHSVRLTSENASLDGADMKFEATNSYSHAIDARQGNVTLTGGIINSLGKYGYGIYTEGKVEGNRVFITSYGSQGHGVLAANQGEIKLDRSNINVFGTQAYGMAATEGGKLSLTDSAIVTKGPGGGGVTLLSGSDLQMQKVIITTVDEEAEAYGLRADNSTATLTTGEINTYGEKAYGVAASNGSVVNIANWLFTVHGIASAGLYADNATTITADNITVDASGEDSFGLIAALGNLTISNSKIANTGAVTAANPIGGAGLYADTGSAGLKSVVALNNTTLRSEAGSGVLVNGSALDLTLSNNSLVYGGNGTALSAIASIDDNGNIFNAEANVTANSGAQLLGNIVSDSDDDIINLTLSDGATLNGATQNVNQLLLDSTGSWLVAADSTLKSLKLQGGSLVFNNASSFNTITVKGDLSGSGALSFNTQLGADDSASDKLLVNGNASGSYDVSINNRGGTGAQTNTGILLVRVSGDSSGAELKQKNAVVAGNYQYFLYKIGDRAWYLQSSLVPVTPPDEAAEEDEVPDTTPPDTTPPDTTPPDTDNGNTTPDNGNSVPPDSKAYRPETAGYLIAPYLNSAYGFETIGTWHERLGAYQGGSVWLRVSGRHDNYDAGRFAFDVNTTFVQLGGDLTTRQLADGWQLTAGPLMTLGHQRSNNKDTARSLRSDLSINVGQTDTNAYGIGGYLTLWNEGGAYLDNVVQLTRYSNEFASLTHAKMDSYGVVASVETGIPLSLGGGLMLEPQLQAMGQYMNISQTHADGVKLKDQNLMMARLREGLRVYYDSPVLKPYVQMDAVQFLGHTPGIDMNNETIRPDVRRGYWQAGAGLSSQLNPHFSVYAQMKYSHSFGPGAEGYTGNMGFRYKF